MSINDSLLGPMSPTAPSAWNRHAEQFKASANALHGAQERSPEGLKKIAQEFEALFLGHLIKVMNETIDKSELLGQGLGSEMYTDMLEQGLATKLSETGGLGLSNQIYEFLRKRNEAAPASNGTGVPNQSGFLSPVSGRVTSAFGYREDPMTGDVKLHKGTDLAAAEGTPIRASKEGKVIFSGSQGGYGNTIVIEHAGGFRTRYAHLRSNSVSVGEQVRAGQTIGQAGSTGRATGPHLHFEVLRNNDPLDPKKVLWRT